MSATHSKKELVDFLWEWAQPFGDWAKHLVCLVVQNEGGLSDIQRSEVFDYFLQSIGLKNGLPVLEFETPTFSKSRNEVQLRSLSQIEGVNRLAVGQQLIFSKNLTVVYGENSSGKTGYVRVVRALGFSYAPKSRIISDIFEDFYSKQSARVEFAVNGKEQTPFEWNGENQHKDLRTISVFDNGCIDISLGESRTLLVTPIGFQLFSALSRELDSLDALLSSEVLRYPTTIEWTGELHGDTTQFTFIAALNKDSDQIELDRISEFNEQHEQEIQSLKTESEKLNKPLLESEIQSLLSQTSELNSLIDRIRSQESAFTGNEWKQLKADSERLVQLLHAEQKSIKQVAENKGIEFYESVQFSDFLKAADNYLKLLNKPDYPTQNDFCIYCRQLVQSVASVELLRSYREIMRDTTQVEIVNTKSSSASLKEKLLLLHDDLELHHASFGFDENKMVSQPMKLVAYNKAMNLSKASASRNDFADVEYRVNPTNLIETLTDRKKELETETEAKQRVLANLTSQEALLHEKLNELFDRSVLSKRVDEIRILIQNKKIIAVLESNRYKFKTYPVSQQTTNARKELIQDNFITSFQDELIDLRRPDLKIELNFETEKGQSNLVQNMRRNHTLQDILSEGEQKAVALAEFLAELRIDKSKSPVIFDDPVNSLDHHIIDEVARKLVKLSRERQVVVFTHSVLLLNDLIQNSGLETNKDISFLFFNVRSEFGKCGVLDADVQELNSYISYEKKINAILSNPDKTRKEVDQASDGYAFLRSAIEITVEKEILKDTIKRYRKNVALTSFQRVNGALLEKHKVALNEIFERCNGFIKGHSNPTEIVNEPSLAGLLQDFNELKKIRKEFTA